jgi:hypothetical protein
MILATTIDDFCDRIMALLDDPAACKCPRCGGQLFASHGLAGGGVGPYLGCLRCGDILIKHVDATPEAPV